ARYPKRRGAASLRKSLQLIAAHSEFDRAIPPASSSPGLEPFKRNYPDTYLRWCRAGADGRYRSWLAGFRNTISGQLCDWRHLVHWHRLPNSISEFLLLRRLGTRSYQEHEF